MKGYYLISKNLAAQLPPRAERFDAAEIAACAYVARLCERHWAMTLLVPYTHRWTLGAARERLDREAARLEREAARLGAPVVVDESAARTWRERWALRLTALGGLMAIGVAVVLA